MNPWKKILTPIAVFGLLSIIFTHTAHAALQPDYYAEPGLNPQHDCLYRNTSEFIDPFSGTLQHQYIDLLISGNGGLDIKESRGQCI